MRPEEQLEEDVHGLAQVPLLNVVYVQVQVPFWQVNHPVLVLHVPQLPPQPSSPQCLPLQLGV